MRKGVSYIQYLKGQVITMDLKYNRFGDYGTFGTGTSKIQSTHRSTVKNYTDKCC